MFMQVYVQNERERERIKERVEKMASGLEMVLGDMNGTSRLTSVQANLIIRLEGYASKSALAIYNELTPSYGRQVQDVLKSLSLGRQNTFVRFFGAHSYKAVLEDACMQLQDAFSDFQVFMMLIPGFLCRY